MSIEIFNLVWREDGGVIRRYFAYEMLACGGSARLRVVEVTRGQALRRDRLSWRTLRRPHMSPSSWCGLNDGFKGRQCSSDAQQCPSTYHFYFFAGRTILGLAMGGQLHGSAND